MIILAVLPKGFFSSSGTWVLQGYPGFMVQVNVARTHIPVRGQTQTADTGNFTTADSPKFMPTSFSHVLV